MNDDWQPIETCPAAKQVWLLSKAHFFPFLGHIGHTNTGLGTTIKDFFDERGHIVFPIAWMEKGESAPPPAPPIFVPSPNPWKPIETCTAGKVVWLLSKGNCPFLGHAGWSDDDGGREFFDERGYAQSPIAWMEKGDWTKGEMPPLGPVKPPKDPPGLWSNQDLEDRKKAGLPLLSTEEADYPPYLRFEIAGVQQDIKQIREDIKQIREIQILQSERLDRLDPNLARRKFSHASQFVGDPPGTE